MVKRISSRASVLPNEAREKAETAVHTIKNEIPRFMGLKRTLLTSRSDHANDDFSQSLALVVSTRKTLLEVAQVAPEFSVNFEVEYYDDSLGIGIAALAAAVDRTDEPGTFQCAREVVAEVQKQVGQGRGMLMSLPVAERENVLHACDAANAAVGELVKASRNALQARMAAAGEASPGPNYFEAEKKMVESGRALRQAIDVIPLVRPVMPQNESMALLDAARKIVLNLGTLLVTPQ